MKIYLHTFITLLLLASCSEQEKNLTEENSSSVLKGEVVTSLAQYGINMYTGGIVKHGNSLAIMNYDKTSPVSIVNLSDNTSESWGTAGENHLLTNLTTDAQGNFTTTDIQTESIHEVNPTTLSRGSETISPTTSPESNETPVAHVVEGKTLMAAKGHNFIISTGLYTKGRYRLLNTDTNKENYFLNYQEHPDYPNLPEFIKSILYASANIQLRPDEKMFACTDMYSGLIDICRINQDKIELVCRHNFYSPKVYIENGDVAYAKEYGDGFISLATSNQQIYVLHQGPAYENKITKNTLLIFDWQGNLLQNIQMAETLKSITFDMTDNTLYGITEKADLVKLIKEKE